MRQLTTLCHAAGAAATAGVLCAGLLAFKQVRAMHALSVVQACAAMQSFSLLLPQGNSNLSQQMMRARVAFQVT